MLARGLRAIQVLLMLVCGYLVYSTSVSLVGATPVPETRVLEVAPAPQGALPFERYAIIAERNLFKTREVAIPAGELGEELEESRLRIRLLGTAATTPPELSVASVEDLTKRETLVVRVGDLIGSATVVRIERKRLVVDNRGRLEQISFDEQTQPTPQAKANRYTRATKATRQSTRARGPLVRRPAPPADRPGATPSGGSDLSAYSALKLREGERVTAVNGIPLEDPEQLFERLGEPGPKTIDVVDPEGNTRTVTLEVP